MVSEVSSQRPWPCCFWAHASWGRTPQGAFGETRSLASQQTESKRLEEASNEAPPSLLSYSQRVCVHICVCARAPVQVWKLETCQEPVLSFYPADSRNQIQDIKLRGKHLSSGSLFTCLQPGPLPGQVPTNYTVDPGWGSLPCTHSYRGSLHTSIKQLDSSSSSFSWQFPFISSSREEDINGEGLFLFKFSLINSNGYKLISCMTTEPFCLQQPQLHIYVSSLCFKTDHLPIGVLQRF